MSLFVKPFYRIKEKGSWEINLSFITLKLICRGSVGELNV